MQNSEDIHTKSHRFSTPLAQMGEAGVGNSIFSLGTESRYQLQYIPFEHINRDARLVVVGITPGMNQLRLAYEAAKVGLNANWWNDKALKYIKQQGAFGGSAMPHSKIVAEPRKLTSIHVLDSPSRVILGANRLTRSETSIDKSPKRFYPVLFANEQVGIVG